jgi:CubicO group peptidase (beta-lactamase class C family)
MSNIERRFVLRSFKRHFFLIAVLSVCLLGITCDTASQENFAPVLSRNLAVVTPEEVGMSTERLSRLSRAMQELVDQGRLAGIVTMLVRHGKIAHFETFGHQEISSSTPMAKDSIFRIYSMSKPITGVALMMLYEEGKFRLSDPVAKYIPEFKDLKVAAGVGKNGPIVEDTDHPMTIRELMTHTAGLTYGYFSKSQVDDMYVKAGVLDPNSTLKDMILKLSKIPLRQQPGSLWHYSVAVDVQGYIIEVLSGQRFDVFLKERLFDPLGMKDTGFHVPEDKAGRFAQVYNYDKDNNLIAMDGGGNNYLKPPTFFSGGGGLVSTAKDYIRFCQMLLNGGVLDGVRILSPLTVDFMHRNQLPDEMVEMSPGSGLGFGLDFAVVLNPVEADSVSEGEYFWGGLAGTWFWIDPVEDLIFVGMIQQMGENRPDVRSLSRQLVYQAILEPENSK